MSKITYRIAYQPTGKIPAGQLADSLCYDQDYLTLRQALKRGQVNRVPVMIGTERDENLVGEPTTPSEYVTSVQTQYGQYAPQVLAPSIASAAQLRLIAATTLQSPVHLRSAAVRAARWRSSQGWISRIVSVRRPMPSSIGAAESSTRPSVYKANTEPGGAANVWTAKGSCSANCVPSPG